MVALVDPVDPVTTDAEPELLDDALVSDVVEGAVVVDTAVVVVRSTISLGPTSSLPVASAAAAVSFESVAVVSVVRAWRPSTPTSPTVDATASPVANLRARAAGWRRRRRGRRTDGAATGRAAVGSGASCSSMRRTVRSGFVTTTWTR